MHRAITSNFEYLERMLDDLISANAALRIDTEIPDKAKEILQSAREEFGENRFLEAAEILHEAGAFYGYHAFCSLSYSLKNYGENLSEIMELREKLTNCSRVAQRYCINSHDCRRCTPALKSSMEKIAADWPHSLESRIKDRARDVFNKFEDGKLK